VIRGLKTIETRTWRTSYRGPLLIVASTTAVSKSDYAVIIDRLPHYVNPPGLLPRGAAIGVVDLVEIHPMTQADVNEALCPLYPRAYAWTLENPRSITPIPMKGKLNVYDPPDEVVDQVFRRLEKDD